MTTATTTTRSDPTTIRRRRRSRARRSRSLASRLARICCSFISPRAYPPQRRNTGSTSNAPPARFIPPGRASAAIVTSVAPISQASCSLPEGRGRRERHEQRRDDHAETEVDRVAVERLAHQRRAPAREPEADRGERVGDACQRAQDQEAEHGVRDVPVAGEAERGLHHAGAAGDDQDQIDDDQGQQVVGRVARRVRGPIGGGVLVERPGQAARGSDRGTWVRRPRRSGTARRRRRSRSWCRPAKASAAATPRRAA